MSHQEQKMRQVIENKGKSRPKLPKPNKQKKPSDLLITFWLLSNHLNHHQRLPQTVDVQCFRFGA